MNAWRWGGFVLVLLVSSCSGSTSNGSGSSGSCGSAACGGDLTGTWNAQKVCFSGTLSQAISGCNNPATISIQSATISGTAKFDTGGTWTTAFNETFSAHVTYGQGCITSASQCSQAETGLKQQTGITSASCSFGSTCGCDYSGTSSVNQTGTYQINGTSVTLTTAGSSGQPETDGYCVSGNTLTLTSNSSGPASSFVFTK